jgi:hypothetical protein
MDYTVIKKARSWLVVLHPCSLTNADCASYVWPSYVKYAKWSLDGANAFRAYVECVGTRHVLKLPGLDGARVFSMPSIMRDVRRAYVVENVDGGCASWEFGAWERKIPDHTKRPRPITPMVEEVGEPGCDTDVVKSLRDDVDRLTADLTTTFEAFTKRITELEACPAAQPSSRTAGVVVNNNIVINNFGNEDLSHISNETR